MEEWKDARAVCRPAPRAIIISSTTKTEENPSSLSPHSQELTPLVFHLWICAKYLRPCLVGKASYISGFIPLVLDPWMSTVLSTSPLLSPSLPPMHSNACDLPASKQAAGKRNFKITNFNRLNVLFHHIPPRASAINLRHLRRSGGKTAVGRERAWWLSRCLRVGITANGCKRALRERTEHDPEVEQESEVFFPFSSAEWCVGWACGRGSSCWNEPRSDAVPLWLNPSDVTAYLDGNPTWSI